MTSFLLAAVVSASVSVGLVLTKRWHLSLSADASAGIQKFHTTITPRVGGLGISLGVVAAFWLFDSSSGLVLPLLITGAFPFLIGLYEDITGHGGVMRRLLITLLGSALFCLWTSIWVRYVDVPFVDDVLAVPLVGVVFTVLAISTCSNAVNMIDGFNGLAGGATLVMLGSLAWVAQLAGDAELLSLLLAFMGAVFGFLIVNFPCGKIFLGDGGAYLVGFLLGVFAILLPMRNAEVSPWVALVACAYPFLEFAFSFHRKTKREGYSPTKPDGVHLHMLVYKRITARRLRHSRPAYRNAATSPFLWAFAAGPALLAVVFWNDTPALITVLVLTTLAYRLIYRRLALFRWSLWSGSSSTPKAGERGAFR